MPFEQLFPSGARSVTQISEQRGRLHGPMLPPQLTAVLDVTAVPGGDSVSLVVDAFDPRRGQYMPLFRCAARTAIGKDVLHLAEGCPLLAPATAAGTVLHSGGAVLALFRVRVEHSGAGAFTYSLHMTY
jgi:hypothetical protein